MHCTKNLVNIDTHNIDGSERGTERGVHTLPHTRQAAGPVDYGGGVGAAKRLDGASRSIWPGEELCGFCITKECFSWMYGDVERYVCIL